MAGKEELERRQWLVRLGRRVILGAISILSLNLLVRRLNGGCIRPESPCKSCGVFTHCGLPRAEESRQSQDERST
ncbi:MAG: hypothetical protein CMJ64_15345 [Planctomycetaceae bacterium]|jgi:hypothetical protein|nr:hypothetical protein [Planctomycetaceae bacterium]